LRTLREKLGFGVERQTDSAELEADFTVEACPGILQEILALGD
jgi:hypothetical protein